jgi:hypothetical protein
MEIHRILFEKLEALFGRANEPEDHVRHWYVKQAPHADIHIMLDMASAPDYVTIWLFDPRGPKAESVTVYRVHGLDDVERVMAEINKRAKRSASSGE